MAFHSGHPADRPNLPETDKPAFLLTPLPGKPFMTHLVVVKLQNLYKTTRKEWLNFAVWITYCPDPKARNQSRPATAR